MTKVRLDYALARRGVVASRSQAESWIRLGKVKVNGRVVVKAGFAVDETDTIELLASEQYVSRAALKLASADAAFRLQWSGKTVLDVGSSTGGFTQYALRHGAKKVIAVDVGTDQMHPSLRDDPRVELHEKFDIRSLTRERAGERSGLTHLATIPDIVVIDVSFISLRDILPHVSTLVGGRTCVIAMVKPQFEAGHSRVKHKGVIKNDRMRRDILKDFELWVQHQYKIAAKKDSDVAGAKGNVERFYMLHSLSAR